MPCISESQDTDNSNIKVTDDENSESDSFSTSGPQNRNQYPELCKAIDRANVSNQDACLIVNAVLKDLGHLNYFATQQAVPSNSYLEKENC